MVLGCLLMETRDTPFWTGLKPEFPCWRRELFVTLLADTPVTCWHPRAAAPGCSILHRQGMGAGSGRSLKKRFAALYLGGHLDAWWTETTRQSTGAGVPISASLRSHSPAAGSVSMLVNDSWLSHWA